MLSFEILKLFIFCFNSSVVIGSVSNESIAAPFATKRCASSGTIICSGVKCSVSIKRFLNSDK